MSGKKKPGQQDSPKTNEEGTQSKKGTEGSSNPKEESSPPKVEKKKQKHTEVEGEEEEEEDMQEGKELEAAPAEAAEPQKKFKYNIFDNQEDLTDIVGIDLGATNIRLRLMSQEGDQCDPIPASVFFDEDKISVGIREAQTTKFNQNTFYYPKLIVDMDLKDDEFKKLFRFTIKDEDGVPTLTATIKGVEKKLRAEHLLSILFKEIRENKRTVRSSSESGKFGLVIAVPVDASPRYRRSIRNAATAAGYSAIKIVSTAALACMSAEPGEKDFFVADFGFSASFTICEYKGKEITISKHKSIKVKDVNGDKLNQILLNIYKSEASKQKRSVSEEQEMSILLECEDNKKYLSTNDTAYIGSTQIQQGTFEFKADDEACKYEEEMMDFFETNDIEPDEETFEKILCVGSEMNIPLFKSKVAGAFCKENEDIKNDVQSGDVVIANIFKCGEFTIKEMNWDEETDEKEIKPEQIAKDLDDINNIYHPPPPQRTVNDQPNKSRPRKQKRYEEFEDEDEEHFNHDFVFDPRDYANMHKYQKRQLSQEEIAAIEAERIEKEKERAKKERELQEMAKNRAEEYDDPFAAPRKTYISSISGNNVFIDNNSDSKDYKLCFSLEGKNQDYINVIINNKYKENFPKTVVINHIPPMKGSTITFGTRNGNQFQATVALEYDDSAEKLLFNLPVK